MISEGSRNGKEIWQVEENGEATEREALSYEGVHYHASLLAQVLIEASLASTFCCIFTETQITVCVVN